MKKIYWIFALLLLLVAPSACTDRIDVPDASGDSDVPEGMVRMRITPGMLDQSVVVTRSPVTPGSGEITIANCRVLVFDKDPEIDLATAALSQPPASATLNTLDGRLDVLLFEEPGVTRYIYVVANLNSTNANWLDIQDAGVAYTTIQRQLINTLPTSGTIRIEPSALPMSGRIATGVTIEKGTGSPTLLAPSVTLSRSVARIDVDATATKSLGEEFKITGVGVANCPRTGTHLPDPIGKLTRWDVTQVAPCQMQAQTAGTPPLMTFTEKVYTYEHDGAAGSSAEHPLRIVISGIQAGATTESFYGIDIVYALKADPNKKSMEIHRNNIYTIKLNKVRKDGYATYEEAARSASFNTVLDADITVTDPFAHDIVTNGRQYLGVTNTEYVLYPYGDQASQNLIIASFTYTSDPAWMAGQITVPTGITLPTGTQQSLAVNPHPVQRDLVVNIEPTFKEGIIVLHIGNLKKEIKVRRMAPTSAAGGVFSDYYAGAPTNNADETTTFKEFKLGEVINFSAATSWLQVATTDDVSGEAALSNRVVTGLGGVYVHVANNFSYGSTTTLPREASIYLAGDTQGERVKVHVQQPAADVYQNITKIEPFAYVGAFWRHNQTAERIIRMYGMQNSDGTPKDITGFWWQANVVAGMEWIVMDTSDPGTVSGQQVRRYNGGTTPNPYGVGDDANTLFGSDIESSFSCQVNSKLRSVSGTGNYIYFRIGLTGKLANASATPRYGLVMISYGTTPGKIEGYHPIYIRQGEADDYLMRPFDPITRDPKLSFPNDQYPSRPNAVRVSPFNLDAPDNVSADPNDNSFTNYYALPTRGATFTSYPSRTGSYFQGRKISATGLISAFPPSTTTAPPAVPTYGTSWDPTDEVCPRGYRRIQDGTVTAPNTAGAIIGSEIRQSLMLFPAQGGDYELKKTQSALTNQYRGYLADGYFDRLEITTSNNDVGTFLHIPHSIVKQKKAGQAHIGALFFNPNNYASIFLPFAGRWGGAAGYSAEYKDMGNNTTFVSSTPATAGLSNAAWYLWIGNGFDTFNNDFTSMYPSSTPGIPTSLRCVRDDRPIIETGGELPGTNIDNGSGTNIDGINRDNNPDADSDILARHLYTSTDARTLQLQIQARYTTPEKRKQIGSIVISGDKPLTAADYQYLNAWANGSTNNNGVNYSGSTLRHITIHGNSVTNVTIPAGAFTSPRWITIELRTNIRVIEDGAFVGTLVPGLKTLIVAHPGSVTANAAAFQFTTSGVSLRLYGDELEAADVTAKTWKGKTWAAIRKDN